MPYVRKEQIERAKQWDLLTYLQSYEPAELVRCSRNVFSTRTHDSLKISNGKWFWWSRGIGGRSALDYLIKVRGMSFPEAVLHLDGDYPDRKPEAVSFIESFESGAQFELPERNPSSDRVIAYLVKRGIHREVIDYCLETGRLYESRRYHNAVFVGFDLHGAPRYAAIRGTTESRYMGEAPGSDKRYSFSISGKENNDELHLFESATDLLSYCTFEAIGRKNWRQSHKLSLAGIYSPNETKNEVYLPATLSHYLLNYPHIRRLVLHLDNDLPGRSAAAIIQRLLVPTYKVFDETPHRKDVNDDLRAFLKKRDERSR